MRDDNIAAIALVAIVIFATAGTLWRAEVGTDRAPANAATADSGPVDAGRAPDSVWLDRLARGFEQLAGAPQQR